MVKIKFDEGTLKVDGLNIWAIIRILIYVSLIITAWSWEFYFMGHFTTEPLQPYYVNETNPVTRIDMIQSYNSVTGVVTSIGTYHFDNRYYVTIDIDEKFNMNKVEVYLTKKDVKRLHVGDVVTFRGTITVADKEGKVIEVGHKYDDFPFLTFKAKILTITPFNSFNEFEIPDNQNF